MEEVKTYQRKLWEIINNTSTKQEVRIKALDSLQGTTISLANIYDSLPMICHNSVRTADQLQVFNVDNNNSSTTINDITTIATSGPDNSNAIEYLQWCKNNNPKHPDSCDCGWEEYQVN